MKKLLIFYIFFIIKIDTLYAQDVIVIDSSGITLNNHFLGKPKDDTLNRNFSVHNFRQIILKPHRSNVKSFYNEAIVKNKRYTRFFSNFSYVSDTYASIIQFEQVYVVPKFLVLKIGDLTIDNKTTYEDVINSNIFNVLLGKNLTKDVNDAIYLNNVCNLNVDCLINVLGKPKGKIFNISIIFNDVAERTSLKFSREKEE